MTDMLEGIGGARGPLLVRIGKACKIIGEPPSVLHYWEHVFHVRVERSRSGQRVYSRSNLARFVLIKSLLRERRFTIEGASKFMRESGL